MVPKKLNKLRGSPLKNLYHYADMEKLKNDLKIPLNRGLGPALIGTE